MASTANVLNNALTNGMMANNTNASVADSANNSATNGNALNSSVPGANDLTGSNPFVQIAASTAGTNAFNPANATSGTFNDYVATTDGTQANNIRSFAQTAPAAVPQAAAAPAPAAAIGATQAADSNWYVPNPSGPGWMQVSQPGGIEGGQAQMGINYYVGANGNRIPAFQAAAGTTDVNGVLYNADGTPVGNANDPTHGGVASIWNGFTQSAYQPKVQNALQNFHSGN